MRKGEIIFQRGGPLQRGENVFLGEFGIVAEDLRVGRACAQPLQNVPYRDAQIADTRLAGTHSWRDRDPGK